MLPPKRVPEAQLIASSGLFTYMIFFQLIKAFKYKYSMH